MPSTPAHNRVERQDLFDNLAGRLDDDEIWPRLATAYAFVSTVRSEPWSSLEFFNEAGRAVETLVAEIGDAFDIDGCGNEQLVSFVACRKAAEAIIRCLDQYADELA